MGDKDNKDDKDLNTDRKMTREEFEEFKKEYESEEVEKFKEFAKGDDNIHVVENLKDLPGIIKNILDKTSPDTPDENEVEFEPDTELNDLINKNQLCYNIDLLIENLEKLTEALLKLVVHLQVFNKDIE